MLTLTLAIFRSVTRGSRCLPSISLLNNLECLHLHLLYFTLSFGEVVVFLFSLLNNRKCLHLHLLYFALSFGEVVVFLFSLLNNRKCLHLHLLYFALSFEEVVVFLFFPALSLGFCLCLVIFFPQVFSCFVTRP